MAFAKAEGVHLSLDELDLAFSQIDADDDGFISKQELIDYQSKVNAPIVPPVDPQPPAYDNTTKPIYNNTTVPATNETVPADNSTKPANNTTQPADNQTDTTNTTKPVENTTQPIDNPPKDDNTTVENTTTTFSDEIEAFYVEFDADKDGKISKAEMKVALRQKWPEVTDDQVETII